MTPRVAFVNGGILGLTLVRQLGSARPSPTVGDIHAEHFVLSEDLTVSERDRARASLCQRLWPDLRGIAQLDLARFRREMNAGLQARRRLLARGLDHFDVLHFHRQATAYAEPRSDGARARRSSRSTARRRACCRTRRARSSGGRSSSTSGATARSSSAPPRSCRRRAGPRATSRALYPDCRTPIHVMPNPVRLDLFDPAWIDERRARGEARPQCLFIGGDFPRKGGSDLLDGLGARRLRRARRPDARHRTGRCRRRLPAGVRAADAASAPTRPSGRPPGATPISS